MILLPVLVEKCDSPSIDAFVNDVIELITVTHVDVQCVGPAGLKITWNEE